MKLYKKLVLILLPLAFATVSCEDELNLTPKSLIGSNSFWNNEGDVNGALNGMYVRFRGQAATNLFYWGGARSELLSYGLQASQGLENYFENTLTPTNNSLDWKGLYTVLHDCNLLIKNIPGIEFDNETDKNNALAQAHSMRAYIYFLMTRVWGGVPVVTDPTEGFGGEDDFKPRNTREEVVTQIESDITVAEGLFSSNTFTSGRSMWSKPALSALKGNFYLWKGKVMGGGSTDFTTALTALQSVQGADVDLLDDFDAIFRYNNKENKEILMAIHHEDLESGSTFNANLYIRGDQIPGNGDPAAVAMLGTGGGLNRWAPSEGYRNQWVDIDSRKDATFVLVNTDDGSGNYTEFYGSAVLKFKGFVESGSRKFMDDVILYRYADVLLMIAEAKNALGQDPTTEMNLVRQRAYGVNYAGHEFVNGSQAANNDAILQERLFELSFEGRRWFDLLRFDKAFELVPSLVGRGAHLKLFPIDSQTISKNSSIEQNPGFE